MTSQIIDFKTLPANMPVLCIPRVDRNIEETHIRKIFNELNMGTLERIDIVIKKNDNKKDNKFNRVFIHFQEWNDSENAQIARQRLLEGKEIKIIYDEPWFWKISAYKEAVHKEAVHKEAVHKEVTYKEGDLKPNKRPFIDKILHVKSQFRL
jgi:hypothetical protein